MIENQSTPENSSNKVLFVDDESYILFSLRRFFRQNNIEVDVETDSIKAVELIRSNKYKVIISDFRMPTMNGAQFLEIAKEVSPESIRLVLSAHINQESLEEIVNKSEVYRFISKPWKDKELLSIIQESIIKYDTKLVPIEIEKKVEHVLPIVEIKEEINNDTLYENILPQLDYATIDSKQFLEMNRTEMHTHLNYIINLTSNRIGLHCKRVSQLALYLGKLLKLNEESLKNLYFAGMYHDIGKVFELVAQADHSELGFNLLSQFNELKDAAKIIKYHHKRLDGEGASEIPIESKVLAIVDHFDKEVNKELELDEKKKTLVQIIGEMEKEKDKKFDKEILEVFKESIMKDFKLDMFFNEIKIHLTEIEEGMILSRPIFNDTGKLLLNNEYKITKDVIKRLFKHHSMTPIKSPIFIYAKAPEKAFNFEELIGKKIKN